MVVGAPPELTLAEACRRAGISIRQAEHWRERGYLHIACAGPGRQRHISGTELQVLALMGTLVRAGFKWELAAAIARDMTNSNTDTAALPGGLTLHIPMEDQDP